MDTLLYPHDSGVANIDELPMGHRNLINIGHIFFFVFNGRNVQQAENLAYRRPIWPDSSKLSPRHPSVVPDHNESARGVGSPPGSSTVFCPVEELSGSVSVSL